jgi:fumarate hydratase class II
MTSTFDENNANDSDEQFRTEYDSMGEVKVPKDALWRAQTQRAVENFPISGETVDKEIIRALVLIKKAAASVNSQLGVIDSAVAEAIIQSAQEILSGLYEDQFPVDVYQTGSGTSTNMNVNEVLATLASRKLGRDIRPNNEPNASQSSNDVFPSAIHLAVLNLVQKQLIPNLKLLQDVLTEKSQQFSNVVKAGRTHLMDATPVTLGQEFRGYAVQIKHSVERLEGTLSRLGELPLGGTAVGTGINAPKEFAQKVISMLSQELQVALKEAEEHFEAQGARDAIVEISGIFKTIAASFYKIANDLRWMASGPRTGLAEIHLPDLQPGSSIMPGKVNPVVPEAVCQVVAKVIGNDATITFGGAAGNFELNVMLPVIGKAAVESARLLSSVSKVFAEKCIKGIEADVEKCKNYALSSPAIGTALNPHIGYEKAAEVIKKAVKEGKTLKEVILEMQLMSPDEVDRVLDVLAMTQGGIL